MNSHALRSALVWAAAVLVVAGCTTFVDGRALSMLNDPFLVGGLPATNGPSGIRSNAPSPTGKVLNTDNGPIDRLALLSVNDIEDYWQSAYSRSLKGTFAPVSKMVSYDSNDPSSPIVCHNDTYKLVNAFYTSRCNLIAWDRGVFMPVAQKYFGDMSVTGVLAHEFGHALQQMAKLVTRRDPTIVHEQQADCFAGVYLFWVADGKSPRFTLSTADGLDHVLAGIITTRDPVMDSETRTTTHTARPWTGSAPSKWVSSPAPRRARRSTAGRSSSAAAICRTPCGSTSAPERRRPARSRSTRTPCRP